MSEKLQNTYTLKNNHCWWGDIELDIGAHQIWDFGSLLIHLERKALEWQMCYKHAVINIDNESSEVKVWNGDSPLNESDNLKRFVSSQSLPILSISPALPERNLVAKPIHTIMLMPDEVITLYVSVALLFKVSVKTSNLTLCEIPIRELSDTWFGKNTGQGELCYASKTHALVNQDTVQLKPYRAVVPVVIHNDENCIFKIDKVNIPVPSLELRQANNNIIWGSTVKFATIKNSSHIKLSTGKSENITGFNSWTKIANAREPLEDGFITKACDAFFS